MFDGDVRGLRELGGDNLLGWWRLLIIMMASDADADADGDDDAADYE